ncbi:MAG: lipocalin-like domain-containing protein [Planctomycetota bacterium]
MRTICKMILLGWIPVLVIAGCYRSSPPQIKHFKPPIPKVVKKVSQPDVVVDAPKPETAKPTPTPEPTPEPEKTPSATPTPSPTPQPKKEETPAPSIIGTWRVTEMTHNGQTPPQFDSMEMNLTFTEDGNMSMTMSGDQLPQAMTREGTYTVSDNTITMTMDGRDQTGTLTFEGSDQAVIEIDQARMVLTRS